MAFLEISGLRKRFGSLEVLKGIDLTLDKGGFLVLIGPSGCGKSTLLSTIAGLETISAGEIRIEGQRINDLHPSKRDIAMVFQSYALYPNMTVAENMAFGMEMRGVAKPEREKAVAEVAKTLQLEHLLKPPPEPASRGAAPARRDGARIGSRAPRLPVRRAAFQSRCQAAGRYARGDQAPAPATGSHDRLCHARSDRSHDASDAHRRPEARRASAGRHAISSP